MRPQRGRTLTSYRFLDTYDPYGINFNHVLRA